MELQCKAKSEIKNNNNLKKTKIHETKKGNQKKKNDFCFIRKSNTLIQIERSQKIKYLSTRNLSRIQIQSMLIL